MNPTSRVVDALERSGCRPKRSGDSWSSLCPVHEIDGDSHAPSLSVSMGEDGRALLKCHAGCAFDSIVSAIGLQVADLFASPTKTTTTTTPKIVATYDYVDEAGAQLFQKVRFEPKDFRQRRRDAAQASGWTWNLRGVRPVLYRLPELLAAVKRGDTVYLVEGEKDVETLIGKCGVVATCNPQGAACKWKPELAEFLRGASVALIADKDEAGYRQARTARDVLQRVGAIVEVFEAAEGKDASDHVAAGLGLADLVAIDLEAKVASNSTTEGTSAAVPFTFLGVADLVQDGDAENPTEYLVDGVVPLGALTLLVGRPKGGKTTLVFSMLRSLERGERWLDRETIKTPCVYLSEEGGRTLADKAKRFGIEQTRFLTRRHLLTKATLSDAVDAAIAEAQRVGARLLVVDTMAAWTRIGPEAENDAGAVLAALEPLAKAAEAGLAVLVIHHSRKAQESKDPADAVRGSGAIVGAFDVVLELKRGDTAAADATARRLGILTRFEYDGPAELHLDLVGDTYVCTKSGEDARAAGERRRILEVLADADGPLKTDEIRERAKVRKQVVGRALDTLDSAREVIRFGSGKRGNPYSFSLPSKVPPTGDSGPPLLGVGTGNGIAKAEGVPGSGNGLESQIPLADCLPADVSRATTAVVGEQRVGSGT